MRHLPQSRYGLGWIESEGFGKLKKFNNVDTALSAFQAGNEGLVLPQPRGQIGLCHACRLSLGDEQLDQRPLTFRSKCLCQSEPRQLTAGSRE